MYLYRFEVKLRGFGLRWNWQHKETDPKYPKYLYNVLHGYGLRRYPLYKYLVCWDGKGWEFAPGAIGSI